MNSDPFYKVILEAMITDTQASLRMLEPYMENDEICANVVAVKSSLRRAITDAKQAMKGFEG